MSEEKQKPAQTWRFGGVKGSLWVNKSEKDGREVVNKTLSVSRTYKDKSGEWKESHSYDIAKDLPRLIAVAQAAYAEANIKRDVNSENKGGDR